MKRIKNTFSPAACRLVLKQGLLATAVFSVIYMLPIADSLLLSNKVFSNYAYAQRAKEDEQRPPPTTRQSETLSRRVYERIEKVMEFRDAENYTEARKVLDEIKEMNTKGQLNNREKQTLFLFYANLDQIEENYDGAIANNLEILKIEELPQEVIEQTWSQLASLYYVQERYRDAIDAFNKLNEIALEPKDDTYLRLAYAYYQLEEYSNAVPVLLRNFELLRAKGEMIPKNSYGLLRALYLTLEDYPKAYQVVRESVILYNDRADWVLLAQLSAQMEKFSDQAYIYYIAGAGGFLDSSTDFETLASLQSNNENPYGCAETLSQGLDKGIVDADEDNFALTATCYRLAREDKKSIPYLEKAAALSEDGENYATLARVFMTIGDFESSIGAFKSAFDKGGLNRQDQVCLLQARALLELHRFDEGVTAARCAAKDPRSADLAQTWITHINSEKELYETLQKQRRDLAEWFKK